MDKYTKALELLLEDIDGYEKTWQEVEDAKVTLYELIKLYNDLEANDDK